MQAICRQTFVHLEKGKTMSDYIDREETVKTVRLFNALTEDEEEWEIRKIPSADVVDKSLFDRARILLKATYELLNKQVESYYVLNILEETVFYDNVECDGGCLMEDIDEFFFEIDGKGLSNE